MSGAHRTLVFLVAAALATPTPAFKRAMPTARIHRHLRVMAPRTSSSNFDRPILRMSADVGGKSGGSSSRGLVGFLNERAPGIALAGTIATVAEWYSKTTPISPLLFAALGGIVVGTLLRAVDADGQAMSTAEAGMKFAKQRLLRAGIILYGAKITFASILGIGMAGLLSDLYR